MRGKPPLHFKTPSLPLSLSPLLRHSPPSNSDPKRWNNATKNCPSCYWWTPYCVSTNNFSSVSNLNEIKLLIQVVNFCGMEYWGEVVESANIAFRSLEYKYPSESTSPIWHIVIWSNMMLQLESKYLGPFSCDLFIFRWMLCSISVFHVFPAHCVDETMLTTMLIMKIMLMHGGNFPLTKIDIRKSCKYVCR